MKADYLLLVVFSAALLSCQKDDSTGGGSAGDSSIWCAAEVEGDGFTKGYVIDGTAAMNTGINRNGNSFVLDAWLEAKNRAGSEKGVTDDKNPHYLDNKVFTTNGSSWSGEGCTWRNDVFTNFWAVFPKMDSDMLDMDIATAVPSDAEQKTPKLTYDMSSLSLKKGVSNAGERSKDVLVAYARQKYKIGDSGSKSNISFQFYHALSAIKFKMGADGFTSGCDIKYLTISGIHLKGECVCTGNPNAKPQSTSFVWTATDTPDATDAFSLKQTTTLSGLNDMFSGGKVFFLIPQEMPSTAVLSAYITGGKSPGLKSVNITGYSWLPGKEYTYSLSYDQDADKLEVSITESYSISTGTWAD